MKLAIFGGSGKTGRFLLEKALQQGHDVVALARTPSKVTVQHPNLTIIQGDSQDLTTVERVVSGADAVISVLGRTNNAPEMTITISTQNIINAMEKFTVRRLVIVAGAGVGDPKDKPGFIDGVFKFLLGVLSKNAVTDMIQVTELVRASGLEWTIVRAPMLTDDPAKTTIREGYLGSVGVRLSREDLAAFTLQQVADIKYLRQAPVISN